MSPKISRRLGIIGLILGLIIYWLVVVVLTVTILPINTFVDFLFYAAGGLLWIFPARWLIILLRRKD